MRLGSRAASFESVELCGQNSLPSCFEGSRGVGLRKPLHGGPVSPWPRRARRFAHHCVVLLFTCGLATVFGVVALVWVDAVGPTPVGLASILATVMVYHLVGVRPVTVAFVAMTALVALAPDLSQRLPELEGVVDDFMRRGRDGAWSLLCDTVSSTRVLACVDSP